MTTIASLDPIALPLEEDAELEVQGAGAGLAGRIKKSDLLADVMKTLADDAAPTLGGDLTTDGKRILVSTSASEPRGVVTNTSVENGDGIALVYSIDGLYDPLNGAILVDSSGSELHGASTSVESLKGVSGRQVYCTAEGVLYPVEPPAAGWEQTDTSVDQQELTTLGAWVQVVGLTITVPEDVLDGSRLDIISNIYIEELSGNRSGAISVGIGINGAAPTGSGIVSNISGGFAGLVPTNITTTTHGGLITGDTIELWVMRESESHIAFAPWLNGTVSAHELVVSVPAGALLSTVENLWNVNAIRKSVGATEFISVADKPIWKAWLKDVYDGMDAGSALPSIPVEIQVAIDSNNYGV